MNGLRKFILFLLVLGFGGLILLNAGVWTARMTILDRDVTKSWLRDSNVYDNFINEVADLVKQDQENRGGENPNGSFDIEALERAAKEAFPADNLREKVEAVLNGTYDWLEGATEKLVFNLDFTEEKKKFIDAMGNEGLTRLAGLPSCQEGEAMEEFDPFSATCLPTGTDINAQIEKFKFEVANSQEVLPDTTLSNEDVKLSLNGERKSVDSAFSNAPRWYGWLKSSPIVLAIITVIDSAIIVLLCRPKRSGFKILAWFFGVVGGLLTLLGGISILLRESIIKSSLNDVGDGGIAENILFPLVREVSSSTGKWNMIMGGIYIAAAIVLGITYASLNKKSGGQPPVEEEKKTEPETLEKPKEEPKPEAKEAKEPPAGPAKTTK